MLTIIALLLGGPGPSCLFVDQSDGDSALVRRSDGSTLDLPIAAPEGLRLCGGLPVPSPPRPHPPRRPLEAGQHTLQELQQ